MRGVRIALGATRIPNKPGNDKPANCSSGVYQRLDHANVDVAWNNILALRGHAPLARRNTIVEVEYDDGSTETWAVGFPVSTTPLAPSPVGAPPVCRG